jgi:CBS domain-containing protein
MDAVGPLALHRAIAAAQDAAAVAEVAAGLPAYFLDLVDAGLEAPAVSRSLTHLYDDITRRLLTLAMEEHGRPSVDFAWLALGSAARCELTLASDQDSGLAYAGAADSAVDAHLARIARYVTSGLAACGLTTDGSGVTAADARWRLSLDAWAGRLARCLAVPNESHIMGASIAFDCRKVAGDLDVAGPLSRVVRAAPQHPAFLSGIGATVREVPSPLRFPRRLGGRVDLKRSGLLAIANLARYLALSHGLTATGTLDRLAAIERLGLGDEESMQSLQSSFVLIADLRMRHQAGLLRAGESPDNEVDTDDLPRIVRAGLQEALRIVDESQRLLPPVLHGWA